jgi:outer membrane protein TolC
MRDQLDSLDLALLCIDISRTTQRLNSTSFLKRLIPKVTVTASYGVRELVFFDPFNFMPYILPRDSYRLTLSFSLNDVLDFSGRVQLLLDLERLNTELSVRKVQQSISRTQQLQQVRHMEEQLSSQLQELQLLKELLCFDELRFNQGKIEFDALIRTKLEISAATRSIQNLRHQLIQLGHPFPLFVRGDQGGSGGQGE